MTTPVLSPTNNIPSTTALRPKKTTSSPSAKVKALALNAPAAAAETKYRKIPKNERKSNKGWAEGKREELLLKMIPAFLIARKEGWQAESQKLLDIQNCYHNHFPYPMEDADEPVDMIFDIKATSPPVAPSLGVDEARARLKYIASYSKRVTTWIKRVAEAEEGGGRGGRHTKGEKELKKILTALEPGKKKARSVVQHWLHENWFKGACISTIVATRWASRDDSSVVTQPPNYRMEVATELFEELAEEEKEMWKQSTIEYTKGVNNAQSATNDAVEITAAVSAAPGLLYRLARGVEERTSTRVFSMMAGPMSSFGGDLGFLIINGEPNKAAVPQTFPEFIGREKTKELRELYKAWVQTCFTEEEKRAVIVTDPSAPDWKHHFERLNTPRERTLAEIADRDRRALISMKAINYLYDQGRAIPENDEVSYQAGLYLLERGEIDETPFGSSPPGKDVESGGNMMDKNSPVGESNTGPVPPAIEDVPPPPAAPPSILTSGRPTPTRPTRSPPTPPAPPAPPSPPPFSPPPPSPPPPSPPSPPPPAPTSMVPPALPTYSAPTPIPTAVPQLTLPDRPQKRPATSSHDPGPAKRPLLEVSGQMAVGPPPQATGMSLAEESVDHVEMEVLKEEKGGLAWTVSCLTEFVSATGGEQMAPLILSLLRLERIFQEKGLRSSAKQSIPSLHRPALLGIWMKAGRCDRTAGQNLSVSATQLGKFVADIHKWWDAMQPVWRVKDNEGRWKREAYGDGWGPMMCPGRNGMLSVIATLSWWGRRLLMDDEDTSEWLMMIVDVKWVVDGLIAST